MNPNNDKPIIDFETERLHIRAVKECDKEAYMALRIQNSMTPKAYEKIPGFRDYEWEGELNDDGDLFLSVFLKPEELFVASASIQHYNKAAIEIGYDVVKEYHKQGIATELIKGLVKEIHRIFSDARIIITTDRDNAASRRVAEKCGGTLTGFDNSIISKIYEIAKEGFEGKGMENDEEYRKIMESIEEDKNSVCVYELP